MKDRGKLKILDEKFQEVKNVFLCDMTKADSDIMKNNFYEYIIGYKNINETCMRLYEKYFNFKV